MFKVSREVQTYHGALVAGPAELLHVAPVAACENHHGPWSTINIAKILIYI